MGQTLTNGIYLPAEGERNCYTGLAANWTALDSLIGGYNAHIGNATIHVTAEDKAAWNGKADASALTAHTGDTTIHVTAEDKTKWDAVTGKANDADVVHKSRNETVGGVKTFTDNISLKSLTGEYGVTGGNIQFDLKDKNGVGLSKINQGVFASGVSYITLQLYGRDSNNQTVSNSITYQYASNLDKTYLLPTDNSVWLGSVGRRWKSVYATNYYYGSNNVEFSQKFVTTDTNQTITGSKTFSSINGVEPSSLSLPDLANKIDISSYITDLAGGLNNYTPPANGWICVQTDNSSMNNYIRCAYDVIMVKSSGNGQASALSCLIPVIANNKVGIRTVCTTLSSAYFIPCQGNV